MTRPMCKLCGVEYPQPVTLDEVPEIEDDEGSGESYYYINGGHDGFFVGEATDVSRDATRDCVNAGMCHWNEEDAEKHMEALRAVIAHATSRAA